MFRIYCDGSLLYHSNLESMQIFDPSLELEQNKTGSFVFTVYPDHPRYSLVKRMKSIIQVFQDDYLLFRGRVLDEEVGWHNEKTFTCEGELAFLLDTIQRPYDFTGSIPDFLGMLLSNHNAQADAVKAFTLGNVTVTDPNNYIVRSDIEYVNTWEVITKKLIDNLGGFLQVRHVGGVNYLDYLAESTLLAPQKITFGTNLLDLKRTRKGEDLATVIIPLGAKLKDAEGNDTDTRLTIASVNGGSDFLVDADAVKELGTICKTVIFDDVTDPANLKTKGEAYLAESVKQWETIELTAADLATVDKDITSFHLGAQVQVESLPHGLNQRFVVTKLSLKLFDPAANTMTLGKTIKAFSEVVVFQKGDPGKPGQPGQPGTPGKDGKDGRDGIDGVGVASITEQYYLSTSATALSGGSWSGTVPNWADGRFMWTRSVITYTNSTTVNTNPKCVTGAKGSTGTAGSAGKDGISIISVDVMYYQSTSSTSLAGGTWVTTAPAWVDGRFFWEKTVVTYSDGTKGESTPVCISGQKGSTGATGAAGSPGRDGVDGKDGVGVSSITEQYYLSTSATSLAGGSWSGTVPTWVDGRFMWTRSVITYSNGTSSTTNAKCVTGAKGSTGSAGSPGSNGKDGISITKVDVMYYQSTSSTALSGGSWVTTAPAWVDGRFFWEKTVVTYSDGTTDESTPVCISGQRGATGATGAKGDPGSPGANGKDAAVHSLTAPSDTSYMWLDISLDPPLLKRYNPETATWVVVNDTTDIVYNLEQNLLATIQVTGQNIQSIVAESYSLKDDTEALISSVSTEIEQTKNSFEIQFNQFSADIDAVANGTDAEFEEIRKYIRFVDGQILLGEVGNELELQISKDRISFLQDGAEVAYFSNRKLYVTDTQILHSLQIGNFSFMPRSNGNLSFKKVT